MLFPWGTGITQAAVSLIPVVFPLADLPVLMLITLILHLGARVPHAVCLGLDNPSQKLALGSI